jgi:hypothetical protein
VEARVKTGQDVFAVFVALQRFEDELGALEYFLQAANGSWDHESFDGICHWLACAVFTGSPEDLAS